MWLFRKENTGYTGWGDCAVKMKWGTRWPNAKTWEAAGETIAYHPSPPSVKHKRWKPVAKENWSLGRLIRRRYVSSYVDVKTRKNWIQPFKWRRAYKKETRASKPYRKCSHPFASLWWLGVQNKKLHQKNSCAKTYSNVTQTTTTTTTTRFFCDHNENNKNKTTKKKTVCVVNTVLSFLKKPENFTATKKGCFNEDTKWSKLEKWGGMDKEKIKKDLFFAHISVDSAIL